MTRDTKLALVVGFALILAVGVLISDHFASSSRGGPADLALGDHQPPPVVRDLARSKTIEQPPIQSDQQDNPPVDSADSRAEGRQRVRPRPPSPVEIVQGPAGSLASGADSQELGRRLLPHERSRLGASPAVALADLDTALRQVGQGVVGAAPSSPQSRHKPKPETPSSVPRSESGPTGSKGRWHVVHDGESLWEIAQREYGRGSLWTKIAQANPGRVQKDGTVRTGVRLLLPSPASLGVKAPARVPRRSTKAAGSSRPLGARATKYVVGKGETLSEIAQKVLGRASRMEEILELNRELISDPDEIRAGMVLRMPR